MSASPVEPVGIPPGMEQIGSRPVLWHFQRQPALPAGSQPVLFVHGMWGWHWCWSHFIDVFYAAGYHCYAADLPGHGPTSRESPPSGNASLETYVEEIKTAVELIGGRHNNTPPLVVGYSMGGIVVQKALESVPAAGMVLLSSTAPRGILVFPTFRTLLILTKYMIKSFFTRLVWPRDKDLIYMVFYSVKGEEFKLALERYVPEFSRAFRQSLLGTTAVDADKIGCPVSVLGGGGDRMVKPESNKRLAKKYNAPLHLFENRSHWLVREEGWRDICEYILKWFEKNKKEHKKEE